MEIKAIITEQDYNQALERLEDVFNSEIDTPAVDEAEVLSILIEEYEEHYLMGMPDLIEVIKFQRENAFHCFRTSSSINLLRL